MSKRFRRKVRRFMINSEKVLLRFIISFGVASVIANIIFSESKFSCMDNYLTIKTVMTVAIMLGVLVDLTLLINKDNRKPEHNNA